MITPGPCSSLQHRRLYGHL